MQQMMDEKGYINDGWQAGFPQMMWASWNDSFEKASDSEKIEMLKVQLRRTQTELTHVLHVFFTMSGMFDRMRQAEGEMERYCEQKIKSGNCESK